MFKNILMAYIPSIILAIFLILILTITKSKSEDNTEKGEEVSEDKSKNKCQCVKDGNVSVCVYHKGEKKSNKKMDKNSDEKILKV